MQIKAISLFIASYLVISTVAAPTTPTSEGAAAAAGGNAGDNAVGGDGSNAGGGAAGDLNKVVGGINQNIEGLVNRVPAVGPFAGLGGVPGR
jgi:hypothetical protein